MRLVISPALAGLFYVVTHRHVAPSQELAGLSRGHRRSSHNHYSRQSPAVPGPSKGQGDDHRLVTDGHLLLLKGRSDRRSPTGHRLYHRRSPTPLKGRSPTVTDGHRRSPTPLKGEVTDGHRLVLEPRVTYGHLLL